MKNIKSHSKYSKKFKQTFFFTLAMTLSVIALIAALLTVDYTCRSTVFGDKSPIVSFTEELNGNTTMNIHTMGINSNIDVSKQNNAWQFFCELICLPTQQESDTTK